MASSTRSAASSQPIDLGSVLPAVSQPTLVTVGVRIEAIGSALSSRGLAIVAGPPSTGAFVGQRFLTGDTIGQEMVMRFRVAAPDGTKFAATAATWYRATDGGWNNGSAGGSIVDGEPTPNDSRFRTFTASGGEVAVTYSDAGVFADFGAPRTVTIALVTANAAGNKTADRPVAEAVYPARRARFREHPAAADLGGRGRRRSADRGGHQQRARQLRQQGDRRHAHRAHVDRVVSAQSMAAGTTGRPAASSAAVWRRRTIRASAPTR